MNKKAQRAPSTISIFFYVFVFIIVWSLFFAQQLSTWGHQAVVNGGYTGIEALLYENLNFIILIVLIVFILAYSIFGGNQQ